ncbi:hypothetical protein G9A89_023545 [Geosiphon pyriformis]|nr:hypothetical protein G9A89_023545 [Geosiphon pyriformis]
MALAPYNYTIHYKKGKNNGNADSLVITEPEKETILFNMHSNPTAEHFYKERREGIKPSEPLRPIKVGQPFNHIGIDLVRPLTITSGKNRYIAVTIDYLTKWPETKAIQRADAESIAKFIHQDLISQQVQIIGDNLKINSVTRGSTTFRKREFTANNKNKFKVATTPVATTLEYYQSIYTHCKQRFNIPDGIEVVKKSVYQYIENRINNYLFGNYNISEVRSNLYNNLVHYSQLGTEDLNSETLATYFYELNFNIIKYCEKTYLVQSQYTIDFESETETSNKNKLKQYSRTTPNTPTLPKTIAKHLQTPEQGTSSKLPLTITPFPASLVQAQTPNSHLNRFARPEDFTSLRSPTRQQEPLQTSSNLLDFLAENQSEHSETAANKENNSKITKEESIDSENKMTTYIAKIPEFNGEDIETRTAEEWFKNLATPFNDWNAFKAAFLEQFTDNNTSITLRNHF